MEPTVEVLNADAEDIPMVVITGVLKPTSPPHEEETAEASASVAQLSFDNFPTISESNFSEEIEMTETSEDSRRSSGMNSCQHEQLSTNSLNNILKLDQTSFSIDN